MARFKIGDHVKIVNLGLLYRTYSDWFKKYNYIDLYRKYKEEIRPNTEHIFIIKEINFHEDEPKILLAAIQDLETEEVFLIDIDGIEKTGPSIENPVDIFTQYVAHYDNKKLRECFEKNIFYYNSQMSYNLMTLRKGINILKNNLNNLKENDEMKRILEIYKEKKIKEIEEKYDKQLKELEENDKLNVYLKQVEETVKEFLELDSEEKVEIGVHSPYMCLTKETIDRREEIIKIIRQEKIELNNQIEEINALLEFSPNYEESMKILRDYGIIDKKKNIIL